MMQLAAPLGLLALLALIAVVVLYSLRPRRTEQLVSSHRLWREALQERRRGFGWQRLFRDPTLLLALLTVTALALALAKPEWLTDSATTPELVVVIDTSASMQAAAQQGSRFDWAIERASELIGNLPARGRALVMTSSAVPVLASAFESERTELDRTLRSLIPTDEAGRPKEALTLALSLLRDQRSGEVVFLTDGAYDEPLGEGIETGALPVRIEQAPLPAERLNVGIVRFDIRPEIGSEERFEVLLGIRNYGASPVTVPSQIVLEDRTLWAQPVALEAGEARTFALPFDGQPAGRAVAEIDLDDDLRADNRAYAVSPTDERLRVLLFGGENVFLREVLSALANVDVTVLDEFRMDRFPEQHASHDVVVFDRIPPPELPGGRFFVIEALPPELPLRAQGWVERPIVSGRGKNPMVENLDVGGLIVERARRVIAVDERDSRIQRLFWADDTELGLAFADGPTRLIYLSFDVARSSFPYHAAFPLFLQEALDWLRPRRTRFSPTQSTTGESVVIELPDSLAEGATSLDVTGPLGVQAAVIRDGRAEVTDTSRAGFYRYSVGEQTQFFAANLTNERESDLTPRATDVGPAAGPATNADASAQTGASAGEQQSSTTRSALPLWPALAMLGLFALLVDWFVRLSGRAGRASG